MQTQPYATAAQALAGTPFAAIRFVEQTASTNADAAALLGDEASAGLTIVAEHQTRGAGRKGRSWLSAPGTALLFTTILPRTVPAADLWIVPFWAALAVRRGLLDHGIHADLRWPNDLLLGTGKVAGILCASRVSGDVAWVACGVGINVLRNAKAENAILPPPAFCDDIVTVDRENLLSAVLLAFNATLDTLKTPQHVARVWETAAQLPGQRYRILKDNTTIAFEATALSLATGGALVVLRDDGTRESIALADARALR
jgi:BirA family biotin operon repressor/biotin-[acetyl-CoA-carboxylase] ligase